MKSNNFILNFGTENNEIELTALANNLMLTSKLIQEINRELRTEKKIEVKIKALEPGSFEVHIELVEKLIDSLFSRDNVEYATSVILGLGGLYELVSFIKGKKPKEVEEVESNKTKIVNEEGQVTYIESSVVNIYNNNPEVRDTLSKQFKELKSNPEIKNFNFYSKDEKVSIEREDFKDIAKNIPTEKNEEKKSTIKYDQRLKIIRPSFEKNYSWDFFYKGERITVKVLDEYILNRVDKGEQFAKGDCLVADIEVTKFYNEEFDEYLVTKDSYKIINFKGHLPREHQKKLF